ncbi:winged helix-turn-helix transcriptional regulator [Candidatus Amarolinea aalborgensis]|jgi:DNA-binding response OmpR family regulator|uniref:winged helix-turn-helix transcriptional regulator n=1 Tax=Candidatus Amarolinea aalborgensis TaxID=2249329 RepID=UPI003BF9EAFC
MAIILLVVAKRSDSLAAVWRILTAHKIQVVHANSQSNAYSTIQDHHPDFLLLDGAATRLVTRRFVERVRLLAPEAGLIGIMAAAWPLADMMDELVDAPILARHVLQCMPAAKQKRSTHILIASPLKLDIVSRHLWIGEQEHHLTPKQSLLLEMFMRRPNETITRRELMERVWDTAYLGDTRTLDVHIRWLREKIEETPGSPKLLITVRGSGYCLTGA